MVKSDRVDESMHKRGGTAISIKWDTVRTMVMEGILCIGPGNHTLDKCTHVHTMTYIHTYMYTHGT